MSRFGWAYVNDIITGSAAAAGPTNSVQFNSGSGVFSGSSNFTFNPTTNVLTVVGTISASNYLGVSGSGGTTSPAGSNKYLQYNSGSVFGASSNLIFDYTTNELILTGNVRVIGQVSASTSLITSGTITAGSNITSTGGLVSSSLGVATAANVEARGNITSTNGSISSSVGLYTNGNIISSGTIQSTYGFLSSSGGIQTNGMIVAQGSISSSNSLLTNGNVIASGSVNASAMSASGLIQANSLKGDGLNVVGVQASNVDGAGDDWTVQFKSGDTGRLTGSSGLTFSGSALTSSIGKFNTIILGRTSTSSSISLNSSQHIVAIDTFNALGSVTLSLPNASILPSGKHYVIKDEGGNANNRNIILSCSVSGQKIDGSNTLTITSPYAAVNIYCDGTSKYFIY